MLQVTNPELKNRVQYYRFRLSELALVFAGKARMDTFPDDAEVLGMRDMGCLDRCDVLVAAPEHALLVGGDEIPIVEAIVETT